MATRPIRSIEMTPRTTENDGPPRRAGAGGRVAVRGACGRGTAVSLCRTGETLGGRRVGLESV